MKKLLILAAAAFGTGLLATPASAGIIDFAKYGAENEGGVNKFNGLSLNTEDDLYFFSGEFVDENGGEIRERFFYSYFDAGENGKPGGLGVCRSMVPLPGILLPLGECEQDGEGVIDGAIGLNEGVSFYINDRTDGYDLRGLSFRDANFDSLNDSAGWLTIQWRVFGSESLTTMSLTFSEAVAMAAAGEFGTIDFISFSYLDTAFFIEAISDVPIPGAIPLLLSGIAGLGFMSRKNKSGKGVC